MNNNKKTAGRKTKSRRRIVVEWIVQGVLFAGLVVGMTTWQSRKLLDTETKAPDFSLKTLEGDQVRLSDFEGKKVVLYFFAPWCTVCNYSSHNIVALRDAKESDDMQIYAVGLAWETENELATFKKDHDLNVPVVVGDESLAAAYKVDTFPTVYIIDEEGKISSRVIGYTTELGLRLRAL